MADVVCLGDLLIDFVPTEAGLELAEVPTFRKAPGGAAANVAVGLARLGVSSAFLGKVGDDAFGHFLAAVLAENGVDVSSLRFDARARTALAFVTLKADGERDFLFYRHPSADMLFRPEEVDLAAIERAGVFHFDSISLAAAQARETALFAADQALARSKLISYDVNLRLPLWSSASEARSGILEGLRRAQVVKLSVDELAFLTGTPSPGAVREQLWHERLELVALTNGAQGCVAFTRKGDYAVPSIQVPTIDTTGAGDGFVAGLLAGIVGDLSVLADDEALIERCRFANVVGAITTTERGAIPALPTRAQVEAVLARSGTL